MADEYFFHVPRIFFETVPFKFIGSFELQMETLYYYFALYCDLEMILLHR